MIVCENCGCRVYNGLCVHCDEENYIEDQYLAWEGSCPETISLAAAEQRKQRDLRRREAE
jgi:hypothetical protein